MPSLWPMKSQSDVHFLTFLYDFNSAYIYFLYTQPSKLNHLNNLHLKLSICTDHILSNKTLKSMMEVVNQFLGYWNLFGHHSLINIYLYQPCFLRPSHIQLSMWYNQIDTNGNKTRSKILSWSWKNLFQSLIAQTITNLMRNVSYKLNYVNLSFMHWSKTCPEKSLFSHNQLSYPLSTNIVVLNNISRVPILNPELSNLKPTLLITHHKFSPICQ
jgi:hypothetical protein